MCHKLPQLPQPTLNPHTHTPSRPDRRPTDYPRRGTTDGTGMQQENWALAWWRVRVERVLAARAARGDGRCVPSQAARSGTRRGRAMSLPREGARRGEWLQRKANCAPRRPAAGRDGAAQQKTTQTLSWRALRSGGVPRGRAAMVDCSALSGCTVEENACSSNARATSQTHKLAGP
jgi:hypothetical protein